MEIHTFTFKMMNKMKNSGSETVAGLTPPLSLIAICGVSAIFITLQQDQYPLQQIALFLLHCVLLYQAGRRPSDVFSRQHCLNYIVLRPSSISSRQLYLDYTVLSAVFSRWHYLYSLCRALLHCTEAKCYLQQIVLSTLIGLSTMQMVLSL